MYTYCLSVALLITLCGCQTPTSGRDWYLKETFSKLTDTTLSFSLPEDNKKNKTNKEQFILKNGCLELAFSVMPVDNVEIWRVYYVEVWQTNALGLRSVTSSATITDPPGRPYPGALDKPRPEEIPPNIRKPTGLQQTPLSLTNYPILLEWQFDALGDATSTIPETMSHQWLLETDSRVALSGNQELLQDSQTKKTISLCDLDIKKILAVPADEFELLFRLTPLAWTDKKRNLSPRTVFIRQLITRQLLESILAQNNQ